MGQVGAYLGENDIGVSRITMGDTGNSRLEEPSRHG